MTSKLYKIHYRNEEINNVISVIAQDIRSAMDKVVATRKINYKDISLAEECLVDILE